MIEDYCSFRARKHTPDYQGEEAYDKTQQDALLGYLVSLHGKNRQEDSII